MLLELNYVFFSFLLMILSAWYYFRRRDRYLLYLTLCFTFLTLSNILQMFIFATWIYGTLLQTLRIVALSLYACFTICAIIALRKVIAKTLN
jgi:hypothetical protein